CQQHNGYPYTF
nr:immunoglobulin light chain junction region [Macaca mulatta]